MCVNYKVSFILLISLYVYSNLLNADEYYNYIKMTCNPSAKSVKLENVDQWNETPSSDDYKFKQKIFDKNDSILISLAIYKDGECVFTNGESIRLRLGSDRSFPYGQCGAAPALWFSLWVNKKKVLSRHIYNPMCNPGNIMEFANVTDKNITFSTYEVTGNFPFFEINQSITHSKTLQIDSNLSVDEEEYPKIKESLQLGDWKVFYENDKSFCSQFLDKHKFKLPKKAQTLETGNFASYEYNGNFEKMKDADYDNDGVIDEAYVLHARTHYNDGDSYFLFSKENNISSVWPNISAELLDKYKKNIFPNQLTGCGRPKGCDYGEYKDIKMLIPDDLNGPDNNHWKEYIDIRYTFSKPFILDGITYFVLTYYNVYNNFGGQGKVIMKPLPNNKAEHMCYFHKITEHY